MRIGSVNIDSILKDEKARLPIGKILQLPVSNMVNVTQDIENSLKLIGINNIFDLGTSKIFKATEEITLASSDPDTLYAKLGLIPSDILNKDAEGKPAYELVNESIEILEGVGQKSKEKLVKALHLDTIREFSLWPPYLNAKRLVNDAYNPETSVHSDPDAPAELLPTGGKHATETLSYQKIFIDQIDEAIGTVEENITELTDGAHQIDILTSSKGKSGFSRPAKGSVLTFTQTWTPHALSLGQLLHSIGLAPGESTKVAIIEWSRKESGSMEEEIRQTEGLTAASEQSRAIEEVQSAVATEVQNGFSASQSFAKTKTGGFSAGLTLGPLGLGGSHGSSKTFGSAISVSSSTGRRDISAEMSQDITASTKQNSTSVRNKRAAVVREVKQEEREEIRTRVITNYNHSHALSVHYYEVVQIYKTQVKLSKYDRCIFIPMKPFEFNDVRIIDRYRTVLYNGALTSFTRELIEKASGDIQAKIKLDLRYGSSTLNFPPDCKLRFIKNMFGNADLRKRTKGARVQLDDNSVLIFSQDDLGYIKIDPAIPIDRIKKIELETTSSENTEYTKAEFMVNAILGDRMVNQRVACRLPGTSGTILFFEFKQPEFDKQLSELLNEEKLYYSQLIWQNLTADEVVMRLAHYNYEGQRLIEQIDAVPLTTYGNYIVFRWYPKPMNVNNLINAEASLEARRPILREGLEFNVPDLTRIKTDWAWEQWKKKHIDLSKTEEAFIPLPTEGVFTEAVLGRYNASEKLDITRFWDWQESPIPHQAPDIAPIQAGSRATDGGLTSPRLESPIVNIQNPQPLPDPAGVGAVLNAITTSNIFRDMSGMQQTAALLQQGIDTTGQAAVAGASLAAQNMKTMADLEAAKIGAVRDVLMAYMGGSAKGSSGSNSQVGAMINQGKKMDEQKQDSSSNSSGTGSGSTGTTTSGTSNNSTGTSGGTSQSHEEDAFYSAVSPNRISGNSVTSNPSTNNNQPSNPATQNSANTLPLEERKNSLESQFIIEKVGTTGNHNGAIPMFAWIVYDFGVNNADPLIDNNAKGPFSIRNQLKERYQELIDQDIWIDIEIYGYTDNSGSNATNQKLRSNRAIKASQAFIPTPEGRKANWVKIEDNTMVIENEINLKRISGAPLDYYLADNNTPEGRKKNRSIIIKEIAMHNVTAPGGIRLTDQEENNKRDEIADKIDAIRNSNNKYDLFKVRAYDLWLNPSADLRIFTEHDVTMAILENVDPDVELYPWNPFDDNGPSIASNVLKYVTDYRSEINLDLKNKNKNVENVLATFENLFRELFNGVSAMNKHLDAVSGISNNPYYAGIRIRDWIISQQQGRNTAYHVALEFAEDN